MDLPWKYFAEKMVCLMEELKVNRAETEPTIFDGPDPRKLNPRRSLSSALHHFTDITPARVSPSMASEKANRCSGGRKRHAFSG
jgi:hypothetical protein